MGSLNPHGLDFFFFLIMYYNSYCKIIGKASALLEMIAFKDGGDVVVFHAMEATKKILDELGML
jgi:hypothetical protein